MDPVLKHIHQQWLDNDTIIYQHLADEGIDTVRQYKKLIGDPNKVNAIKNKTGATAVDISDDMKEKLFCTSMTCFTSLSCAHYDPSREPNSYSVLTTFRG